ncbi:MAG: trypsin-like peptidase domain-containing protein [Planctomycetes bacterium]|nr:trypsin-like peptidase domain-containing protein [Planctomycetota bacterium]
MQYNKQQDHRPALVNVPLIFMVIIIVMLGIYLFRDHSGDVYDPDAAPRPVTPRGRLSEVEESTISLFENAAPSVVFITTSVISRGVFNLNVYEIPQGTGSGFIWDQEGHIVTNYHVIDSALRSGKVSVRLADRSEFDALIVGYDRKNDLAVLHIDAPAESLKPILIGTAKGLRVGQQVFAIGNPFGFDQTLTTGIVSALDREIISQSNQKISGLIQTDAAINPGNSGGPLLDSASRLIGVNTAIVSSSGSSSGIGFAVPVDTVNAIVPLILRTRTAPRAGLGITLFTDHTRQNLGFKEGALVREVYPDSAAEAAGLKSARLFGGQYFIGGDLIVAIDEEKVEVQEDLIDALGRYKVGDTITLTFLRDDKFYETEVKLRPVD